MLVSTPSIDLIRPRRHRCHQCGFRSHDGRDFRSGRSSLLGRAVVLCFACPDVSRSKDRPHWAGWFRGLFSAAFLACLWGREYGAWAGLTAWLTLVLCRPLLVLAHEVGHALAARALGFPVLEVIVGRGPELAAGRSGRTRWALRRYGFLGGFTLFVPPHGAPRWRLAVIYAAGAMANLVAATAAAALGTLVADMDAPAAVLLASILAALVVANLLMAFNALWPQVGVDGQPLDGAQIRDLFRSSRSTVLDDRLNMLMAAQRLQLAGRFGEAAALTIEQLDRWPNDPCLLGMVIHHTSRAEGDHAAVARYRAVVAQAPSGPPRFFQGHEGAVGWLAANVAWSSLKAGEDADLDLVDGELQVALQHLPDAPEVKATLGALFVARGAPVAGEPLLVDALRKTEDPVDRADFARYVARARRAAGQEDRALEAERLARHILDRSLPLPAH
jgi:hypothetical protein